VLSARVGLALAEGREDVALIWPSTGLALAALILFGRNLWPGVLVGTVVVILWMGSSWAVALGVGLGNTLEAWGGATVLSRIDFEPAFRRVQDVMLFLLVGAMGCTLAGATVGVATFWLFASLAPADAGALWLQWWLGDVGGAVVVAPILLVAVRGSPGWKHLLLRGDFWLVFGLCIGAALVAFGGGEKADWGKVAAMSPVPLLVWAGLRLGTRGAVTASFAVVAIVTAYTSMGRGPLALANLDDTLMVLWGYRTVMSFTALLLAAAVAQRDFAEQRYRGEEQARATAERARSVLLERARFTRDVHDGLGSQLVSILAMVERGTGTREELAKSLRNALDDMRIVIDSLDPSSRDVWADLGRLRARLEPQLRRSGTRLLWTVAEAPSLASLSPDRRLQLVRIVQEAVSNAVRHGAASELEVSLAPDEEAPELIRLEIRDDGPGIPADLVPEGRGLANMKRRADLLGADFEVDSCESGTRVVLLLPDLEDGQPDGASPGQD
jgi:signal transduction histidine kinase